MSKVKAKVKVRRMSLLTAASTALAVAEGWISDQLDGTNQYDSAMANLQPIRNAIKLADKRKRKVK